MANVTGKVSRRNHYYWNRVGNNAIPCLKNRRYEFLPFVNARSDKKADKQMRFPKGTYKSGGASKFTDCIRTELVPFIEKNYKTNEERGIYDHSFGGTFLSYVLANSRDFLTDVSLAAQII